MLSRPVQPDVSAGGVHIQHLRPLGEGQVHLTAGGVHVELPAGDRERHVAAGGAHAARLDGQGPGDIPAGAVQLEAPGGHVLQRHVPAPAGDGDGLRPGVPQEYAAAGGLKREGLRRRAGDGGIPAGGADTDPVQRHVLQHYAVAVGIHKKAAGRVLRQEEQQAALPRRIVDIELHLLQDGAHLLVLGQELVRVLLDADGLPVIAPDGHIAPDPVDVDGLHVCQRDLPGAAEDPAGGVLRLRAVDEDALRAHVDLVLPAGHIDAVGGDGEGVPLNALGGDVHAAQDDPLIVEGPLVFGSTRLRPVEGPLVFDAVVRLLLEHGGLAAVGHVRLRRAPAEKPAPGGPQGHGDSQRPEGDLGGPAPIPAERLGHMGELPRLPLGHIREAGGLRGAGGFSAPLVLQDAAGDGLHVLHTGHRLLLAHALLHAVHQHFRIVRQMLFRLLPVQAPQTVVQAVEKLPSGHIRHTPLSDDRHVRSPATRTKTGRSVQCRPG